MWNLEPCFWREKARRLYEVKFDGYRALLLKMDGQAQLRSRRGHDPHGRVPEVPLMGAVAIVKLAVILARCFSRCLETPAKLAPPFVNCLTAGRGICQES